MATNVVMDARVRIARSFRLYDELLSCLDVFPVPPRSAAFSDASLYARVIGGATIEFLPRALELNSTQMGHFLAHVLNHFLLGHMSRAPHLGANMYAHDYALEIEAEIAVPEELKCNEAPWAELAREAENYRLRGLTSHWRIYADLLSRRPKRNEVRSRLEELGRGDGEEARSLGHVLRAYAALTRDFGTRAGRELSRVSGIRAPTLGWRTLFHRYCATHLSPKLALDRLHPYYLQAWGLPVPKVGGDVSDASSVVLAVDASKSMQDLPLGLGLSEAAVLVQLVGPVHVLVADVRVRGEFVLQPHHTVQELVQRVRGIPAGGGTDFRPVFERARGFAPGTGPLVYLTDGVGRYPESAPDIQTLWLSTNQHLRPPFGDVLHIR